MFICASVLACPFWQCVSLYLHGQRLQDTSQYVLSELQALETEQKHIDNRAGIVERRLRRLMESSEKQKNIKSGCEANRNSVKLTFTCAYQRPQIPVVTFLSKYNRV